MHAQADDYEITIRKDSGGVVFIKSCRVRENIGEFRVGHGCVPFSTKIAAIIERVMPERSGGVING
ncbi:hypothetical protein [Paenibacillus glucanolyticus]|uniref:hypothetical protein n=1 Tax=Paenibacillus glucanolyticus TaxID=59843 RepID=UPI00128DE69D|nr:hypothetical protein [Paenibacillus glucanolyticus]MPY20627.1 hypothetical protein [Paenibacillus glucanolyticus]